MQAIVFHTVGQPLRLESVSKPSPSPNEVLIKVTACGVCRTDLHIIDGDLPCSKLPLILGHQIVGIIEKINPNSPFKPNQRVGVSWLGGTCGKCPYCLKAKENLCDNTVFTGYTKNGGFAEYTVADENYVFPLPHKLSDLEVAPLLCAGLIGYRSYRMIENAQKIGFYGFGAAAHILSQLAIYEGKDVYAFTRPGDTKTQAFAKKLGAKWAGSSLEKPPVELDAAIIFAPAGELIPIALQSTSKGGIVVCAGIHMTNIPSFPYHILWNERRLQSITNLTRQDGHDFLSLAAKIPIKPDITVYNLSDLNQAVKDIKEGKLKGSAVIKTSSH